jgi:hypothetical protein
MLRLQAAALLLQIFHQNHPLIQTPIFRSKGFAPLQMSHQ